MTDSDLDNVAAGLSQKDLQTLIKGLQTLSVEQILADPKSVSVSAWLVDNYNGLSPDERPLPELLGHTGISMPDWTRVTSGLSSGDHAKLRAITPNDLQHLLPPTE